MTQSNRSDHEPQHAFDTDATGPAAHEAADLALAGGAVSAPNESMGATVLPPATRQRPSRSLLMQALLDTFSRTGARIGALWIGLLVLLAVFAPFIASSLPLAMKVDGDWHFPLFSALNAIDLVIVAVFLAVIALVVLRRTRLGTSLIILLGVLTVASPVSAWLTEPPANLIFERYRQLEETGEATSVTRTLIPYSPNDRLRDQVDTLRQPPSSEHWLGTTIYGEDMLSRMIHATRVALSIGLIATSISAILGIFFGGLMGYFAGWADLLGMRLIEIIEAIPTLVLLLIITYSIGRNIYLMMIVIGLISWTGNARFIRAEFLKLRKQDFVQAGVAVGLPLHNLLFRHMLPNGIAPVLVNASFGVAGAILLETTLTFLGLGLKPEDPSWGQLLDQARTGGSFNWWIATFPGMAIFLTVFAFVLIGEAMRDAIDPKLRKAD